MYYKRLVIRVAIAGVVAAVIREILKYLSQ